MGADSGDVIVGIDLGTTNSLVAVSDAAGPRVLAVDAERAMVPSVVRIEADGSSPRGYRGVVGEDAFERAVEFPRSTVSSAKRLMGRGLADVSGDLGFLPYAVVESGAGTVAVEVPLADGRLARVSPEEVSSMILAELKRRAEAVLGHAVRRAVVTVPAYFDDAQRQATRDAGRIAGLEVVRIVNEPTAAALAYGLGADQQAGGGGAQHVAVYDFGGGTFDVSILRLTRPEAGDAGGTQFFEVLATSGDTRLGGDDVDRAVVSLFAREIADVVGGVFDVERAEPAVRRALMGFARGVKHRLSGAESAAVSIDLGGGRVYERVVMRAEFEALVLPLVERSLAACGEAMRLAGRKAGGAVELDAVVLVGGSTRMPLVRARVEDFFGIEPYTALDPDRVVALGAAVQASVIGGGRRDALLVDVIPLSLGIETTGGAVAKLIAAGASVPTRATEMFSTSVDGQVSIQLRVLQGEREMAEDCRDLGTFHLAGLPPMPAGVPQVEVTFLVDANGVLRVRAQERRSGKRASLQVVPNHGLTRDEVDRIEAESLTHARDDMQRHRVVDLITNAKLDLKWIGERLEKHRAALEPAYAAELDMLIVALRGFVGRAEADWRSVDADAMYAAKNALDTASVRLQEVGIAESLRGG